MRIVLGNKHDTYTGRIEKSACKTIIQVQVVIYLQRLVHEYNIGHRKKGN